MSLILGHTIPDYLIARSLGSALKTTNQGPEGSLLSVCFSPHRATLNLISGHR